MIWQTCEAFGFLHIHIHASCVCGALVKKKKKNDSVYIKSLEGGGVLFLSPFQK